jgi:hypothetical protein
MSSKLVAIPLLFVLGIAIPSSAGLMINEVVFNEVGSDVTGEWVEIFNTGPGAINLTNYKVGDEEASGGTSATESLFRFPAGASIGSGELQIVAVSATRFFTVYGFNPTYETAGTDPLVPDMLTYPSWDPDGGQINMSNTNDQIVLVGPADTVIDAASWGNNFAFNPSLAQPVMDGQSYERKNAYFDTNTADDWAVNEGGTAAARSTPFQANVPEPATTLSVFSLAALGVFRRRAR